jgi:type IX secretion system PorP/SprF family membrane protein
MLRRNIFILSFLVLTGIGKIYSQDPQLSQFYAGPYYSPSFAGATDGSRAVLIARQQWFGLPNSFSTQVLSYDYNLEKYHCGFGGYLLKDAAGEIKYGNVELGIQYSYDFRIKKLIHIRPGASFSYAYLTIDRDKLVLADQIFIDPLKTDGYYIREGVSDASFYNPRRNHFDGSFSALLYSKKLWVGYTIDHLLRPNQAFIYREQIKIPLKNSFYGGYKFLLKNKLRSQKEKSISLVFLYKLQKTYKQLDVGAYWHEFPYTVGLWYRGVPGIKNDLGSAVDRDAIVLLAGYKYRHIKLALTYDITISSLSLQESLGTIELSATYDFPKLIRRKRYESLPCPMF